MINEDFLSTIKEYKMFQPGELVLVAVSGGADSVALLNLLHAHSKLLGISLHVAHLNHLLRKGDAELDAKFVEQLSQKLQIPVSVEEIDVAAIAKLEKMGIEEAARKVRYEFFERTAKRIGAQKIAVGHTADDNIETFLMRLLRGAGLKGLCGIPSRRGPIVRPLIKVWRREIEDYVGGLKLVPRRDHTNYESKYMRNSVRLKLVPQLKIYNLNIKEIILQTILLLTEDNLYLENLAAEALEDCVIARSLEKLKLDTGKLLKLEGTIQRYLLRLAIEKTKGDIAQISFKHIREILEKLELTEKWELHLPDGVFVLGDKTGITLCRDKPKTAEVKPFKYLLPIPGEVKIEELGRTVRSSFAEKIERDNDPTVAYVDYAVLGKEVFIRSKLAGDRFSPLGVKGTKKIQDYFVDEKIPAEARENIPVMESVGKIVWLVGQRIDDCAKVTPETQKIVKLQFV